MGQIEKEPSYRKICRKCLLQDMDENEYFTDLRKYIAQIDKDLKVEDEEYQNRLASWSGQDVPRPPQSIPFKREIASSTFIPFTKAAIP